MIHVKYGQVLGIIGMIGLLVGGAGCDHSQAPATIQRILGKDIAEYRAIHEAQWCPKIRVFNVSPLTVQCGDPVSLEFAANTPNDASLTYTWEIEGQTFETGQRAVWKTPTGETIGEPEKVFTVRGVVTDGKCSVTRSAEVKVLCNTALDARVHFAFGKATLDATAKTLLDELGQKLQQHPDHTVLIEGHTDYIGSSGMNKQLGQRRAEAVKRYLAQNWGIAPDRVITRSLGEDVPVASNQSPDGRARNRRAEVFRVVLSTR